MKTKGRKIDFLGNCIAESTANLFVIILNFIFITIIQIFLTFFLLFLTTNEISLGKFTNKLLIKLIQGHSLAKIPKKAD